MRTLIRSTTAYQLFAADARKGECAHTTLILFPDEKYLRLFLTVCAEAFFWDRGERVRSLIGKESFSDCLFFPARDAKFTVDDAAKIIDESLLRPTEGEKKLFVLDAFSNASPLVQNKLLKVLEEPPEGVYFLLGALSEHAVLPTVLSRAKKLAVAPFSEKEVEEALARTHVGEKGIREAAAACGGIFSDAEALLQGGGEDFALAEKFLAGDGVEALCRGLNEKKVKSFFAAVKLILRDLMFMAAGQEKYCARKTPAMQKLCKEIPLGALVSAIGFASETEREIKFNAIPAQAALSLSVRIREETQRWQKLS